MAQPADVSRNTHFHQPARIPERARQRYSCTRATYQAPTRRELVLVLLLFIALLVFSSRFVSYKSLSHLDLSSVWHDVPPPPKTYTIPSLPSDTRVSWGTAKVPRTKIIAHVPGDHSSSDFDTCTLMSTLPKDGWTIIDKVYIYNGTVFIVSDEPGTFPNRKFITSTGIIIDNGPEMVTCPPTMTCASPAQVQRGNFSGMAPIVYRV